MITNNAAETRSFAESFAKKILNEQEPKNRALVFGLSGNLGSGKTTFAQGFALGLGIKDRILSPTFVIVKRFKIPKTKYPKQNKAVFKNFYHIDCYRVQPDDILDLGWREIIKNPQNIIVVEWADRIKNILPKNTVRLKFKLLARNRRRIML